MIDDNHFVTKAIKDIVCNGFKMEVSITKMSLNGQIVIPSDIRKALGLSPGDKFLVIGQENGILLRSLKKKLKNRFSSLVKERICINSSPLVKNIEGYLYVLNNW